MANDSHTAASGSWGTVEWAGVHSNPLAQAREFFVGLNKGDKAKVLALFHRLADCGKFYNREKFRALGQQYGPVGRGLFEFKSSQIRFLGMFRPGHRFILAVGLNKKQDRHDKSDLDRAQKILMAYDGLKIEAREQL